MKQSLINRTIYRSLLFKQQLDRPAISREMLFKQDLKKGQVRRVDAHRSSRIEEGHGPVQ